VSAYSAKQYQAKAPPTGFSTITSLLQFAGAWSQTSQLPGYGHSGGREFQGRDKAKPRKAATAMVRDVEFSLENFNGPFPKPSAAHVLSPTINYPASKESSESHDRLTDPDVTSYISQVRSSHSGM